MPNVGASLIETMVVGFSVQPAMLHLFIFQETKSGIIDIAAVFIPACFGSFMMFIFGHKKTNVTEQRSIFGFDLRRGAARPIAQSRWRLI